MKSDDRASKKATKNAIRFRTRYIDHSRRFLDWVNNLDIEKTRAGRIVQEMEERFDLKKIVIIFGFCLLLSFLAFSDLSFIQSVEVGDVAPSDIKSPLTFQFVDEVATEKKRIEAESLAPPVFDYDADVYDDLINRHYKAFRIMRERMRSVSWPRGGVAREEKVKDFFDKNKTFFDSEIGVDLPSWLFEWLIEANFNVQIENIVRRALVRWREEKIVEGFEKVLRTTDEKIIVRVVDPSGNGEEYTMTRDEILDLKKKSDFTLTGIVSANAFDKKTLSNLQTLAQSLILPNLTFNRQETALRRKSAREAVLPIQNAIEKNQIIVSSGAVIQLQHKIVLNEIYNLKSSRRTEFVAVIAALLFLVTALVFLSYLRRFTLNKVRVEIKHLLVMVVVVTLVICIAKLFVFMTDAAFMSKYGSYIPQTMFLFAAPVMAGPMLVGLVIASGELVWLYILFQSIVLSTMFNFNFNFLLVSIVGGIAAARGVYKCERRNDIYWAGLRSGLINAVVVAFTVALHRYGDHNLFIELPWLVPAAFLSGITSSLVAMMFVPLLESVFNIVTDVKLLELSNLNNQLMKDLFLRAPGTYHHSLSVGSMVEAAAKEIEANALLAKVMAYYHDIGKMEHAQYFVENQRPGYNPHDNISPHLSKTILIAHVKDGAEMALRQNLGKPIVDGILQHHGTTLISYFYNKALEEQDEDVDQVGEGDFRYPGPKPQFKEAALVMLADSIEAAARSIDEPTTARLTALVRNIIQSKFTDGQLDECNLTFKEISEIEKIYTKVLLSIYHHRIDYPHMQDGKVAPIVERKRSTKKGNVTA